VAAYRELAAFFDFFAKFDIVPFDQAAADQFDELRNETGRNANQLPPVISSSDVAGWGKPLAGGSFAFTAEPSGNARSLEIQNDLAFSLASVP
jgi:hypothetical protein